LAALNRPSSKSHDWCKVGGSGVYTSQVTADFVRKLPYFRCHDNKGRCSENLNSTIKLAVPDSPLFGANSAAVAFVQAELWTIWVENGQNFKIQCLKEYLTDLHQTSICTGPLQYASNGIVGIILRRLDLAKPKTQNFGSISSLP